MNYSSYTMFRKYPKLFQDPNIKYPDLSVLSFSDYIAQCKTIIAKARQDLDPNDIGLIIESNSPYELRPTNNSKIKSGALLVHGLLDSPFIMKDIGIHLQSQGLLVRSVLLPGHGTVPGALLNVDYRDWLQIVRDGITSLSKEVDKIFLVGFSTGAVCSIYQTLLDSTKIAGIIALAPAYKINSLLDFATRWPSLINHHWKRGQWMTIEIENDYVKYRSIPYRAGYEVYKLTREIATLSQKKSLTCPVFYILSHDDKVISTPSAIKYFEADKNPDSKMIY